jgi:hypothetical protein
VDPDRHKDDGVPQHCSFARLLIYFGLLENNIAHADNVAGSIQELGGRAVRADMAGRGGARRLCYPTGRNGGQLLPSPHKVRTYS